MYYYLRKNGLEMSDYEEVRLRDSSLKNIIDSIKKEFNLCFDIYSHTFLLIFLFMLYWKSQYLRKHITT